uniref:uncharacterized protein F54H12.2-like n=1 Tax=Ciona intestinalis TaxID=7719 RepID=UPI0002B8DC5C|nr:uncharacterized protein F54H12.2-like [Ciona intestinalis]|eukprot:XP_002123084.2 uncharacterized protein F54H12.2-like [Ciona intestinalis]
MFVHKNSCECLKSELDLFSAPMTQTSVQDGMWVVNGVQNGLSDSGTVEFLISGTKEHYIDLANSYLHIEVKIVNADGTNLANDATVVPTNNFFHSLWSQVMMSLNNRDVTSSSSTYPYRSYIENLLTFGPDAKATHLTGSLFYKDTPQHMDAIDDTNTGATLRKAFCAGSRVIDMQGKLHLDLMFQQRYLLNEVDVKLKLTRSKDTFATIRPAGFKVKITQASLHVRKLKISSSVQLGHITALDRGLCKYPITRVEMKTITIPGGNQSISHENLFLGQLPKRVIIGFVDNDAFNGIHNKNPFNFKHYNLTSLALHSNGRQIPSKELTPNFTDGLYIRSYMTLFTGLGKFYADEGNGISRSDYPHGYTLFAFNLTPDLADGTHFDLIKSGDLSLEAKFGNALTNSVNIIIYAEFQNLIQIDRERNRNINQTGYFTTYSQSDTPEISSPIRPGFFSIDSQK